MSRDIVRMNPARGAKWPPFEMTVLPPQTQSAVAFRRAVERIQHVAGQWLTDFHHIGSTSIPGMPGTGIIDVLSPVSVMPVPPEARAALESIGFVYENDMRDPTHLMLGKGLPRREQHLHVTLPGSAKMRQWLVLRDFLRSHPSKAAEYAATKIRADRESNGVQVEYFTKKQTCLFDLISQALKWDEEGRPEPPPSVWPAESLALSTYEPQLPAAYASAAEELSSVAGTVLPELHHIGSTAVPGMTGRPIIDILAPIAPETRLDAVRRALSSIGYVFEKRIGSTGRLFGMGFPSPRFHVHVVARGTRRHRESIGMRDYLKRSPHEAAAYSKIRRVAEEREVAGIADAYQRMNRAFAHVLTYPSRQS
jgi:GrpB-like predicted nucleotidyltransferase (UPF0157 family)